ncbi:MAG TPA: serine/threonine-protein kinase [Kofleriaceae bacterium]|nr:serine/threonine-protein kinase [Kofleriaceae bacterium]
MIGTILHDRWRILAELGKGGMGEVWLAEHLELNRKEAIKILMPGLAGDPQFVSRFRREARAVNRLRHPNIIAIYDFGQLPDGRFYLSMEYADGQSVYNLVKRDEHFVVPRALHVLGQLAYAVHHAHSRGVVHRDLKPDNLILVGEDEMLKVLDFGVAKIVASDHNESVALSSNNLVWGSPRYMAPERVRGVGDDPRSDIYAIGCIAFELVIGSAPFTGNSDDVIRAHLKQTPEAPSTWRPSLGIPTELDAIILRCLAKKPEDRFQTAADLYAAITKVPGFPTAKAEPRRRFVPVPRRPTDHGAESSGPTDARGALRMVADAMLAAGATDPRLRAGTIALRDCEQSLTGLEAAQNALEHELAALGKTGDRGLEENLAGIVQSRGAALDKAMAAYDVLEQVVEELLPAYATDETVAPLAAKLAVVKRQRQSQ